MKHFLAGFTQGLAIGFATPLVCVGVGALWLAFLIAGDLKTYTFYEWMRETFGEP